MIGDAEWSAVALSLKVAFASTLIATPVGIAIAWLLARCEFRGKFLVDAIVHAPLVLPPVVIGYLLLRLLGRRSGIGGWLHDTLGIDIAFTLKGAVIASAVMGFPLLVRAVRLSMEAVDPRLEQAARTLGAGPWRVLRSVTLPLAMPGVIVGCTLAFARSLGEFGATITLAGSIEGVTQTIPSALYAASQSPDGDGAALRLVLLSLALALAALVASEALARRVARRGGVGGPR